MQYGYNYGYSDAAADSFLTMFGVIYGAMLLIVAAVGIAAYVIQSIGLHTIAKRRGLNHPWVVWLPVGCEWVVGSLSDQYRYLVHGQVKNRRKLLLGLGIASAAIQAVTLVVAVFVVVNVLGAANSYNAGMIAYSLSGQVMLMLCLLVALIVLSLVLTVFRYICLYDVFRSCDPGNGTVYLVLSIIGSAAQSFFMPAVLLGPILLLVCRTKDEGMPPRRETPEDQPQYRYYGQTQEQFDQPYYYEPPKDESREPWEDQ